MPRTKKNLAISPGPQQFFVVGIGASAGGLDAFKRLISEIPEKSGMAYVLVQHLAPSHESALPEILARVSRIPVSEITDEVKIEPDHIYVIPANKILTTSDGVLKLSPRDSIKTHLIIDVFFTSLAVVRESFGVGIILSGSGTDGTLGLKMIKEHGGITIAQDQQSAHFDDMPQSAIHAGVVDFVLAPEKIPEQLVLISNSFHSIIPSTNNEAILFKDDETLFKQILSLLHQRSGVDFTYYKQNTIRRRIARRMAILNKEKLFDFLKLLRTDKNELDNLFQDMLIPVTQFFRDPKTFDLLSEFVFPTIFKHKNAGASIRLWIAGCSTGEETYSIAMRLNEYLGKKTADIQIQIFASDISEQAIKKARSGIYHKNEIQSISEEYLKKYFTKTDGSYQVNKSIRDICVFAIHNFLKDPPFAKMDLISCRNVMIYMDSFLQKKALTMFHYALNESGMLLLGKSENISAAPDLFSLFSKEDKIYSRRPVAGRFIHVTTERKEESLAAQNKREEKPENIHLDFRKSAEAILISRSPASVIVNDQMDIVHIHGDLTPFLKPSPGKPTFNVFKMSREGLGFELRNALHKVKNYDPVIKEAIQVKTNGKTALVTIEVIPLTNTIEPHFLILFSKLDTSEINTEVTKSKSKKNSTQLRYQQIEKELSQTREDMRSITEEHDAAYEELQSANEELQSSNEEMQSLNEELETSKEELQSANEELTIVNQELLDKQEQLSMSRHYSESIVRTVREPLVILDKNLRIKTANFSFYKKFNLTEHQTEGKIFYQLQENRWDNIELRKQLERILPEKKRIENFEISLQLDNEPVILILNAQQIINQKSDEELILLAFEDITHSVINRKLILSETRFRQLAESLPHMIWTATPQGTLTYINQVMQEYIGFTFDKFSDDQWHKIISPLDLERTIKWWNKSIKSEEPFKIENRIRNKDGMYYWHLTKAVPQKDRLGNLVTWLGTHTNIEDQKSFSEKLEIKVKERTRELEKINFQLNQFAHTASHDLQEPLRKIMTFASRLKYKNKEGLSDDIMASLEKIENASLRMSFLIRDLLNYSRLSNFDNLFHPIDLNELIKEILNDFELLIQEKQAEIKMEELPTLEAIPSQLTQLFYNIIGNGLKFSKEDIPPVLSLTSHPLSQEEIGKFSNLDPKLTYFEIIIQDNGIGFDQKYSQKIFNIFQRLHTFEYAGTGIGLALSKKIVANHHGEIFAESIENQGAAFHIILPTKQSS